MIEGIEGIEILKKTRLYDFSTASLISMIMFILLGVTFLILFCNLYNSKYDSLFLVLGAISIVCAFIIPFLFIKPINNKYEYKVIIEDSASINDLYDKYEIIEKDGKIYTIQDK